MYLHIFGEQTSEQRRCQPAIGQHGAHKKRHDDGGKSRERKNERGELNVQAKTVQRYPTEIKTAGQQKTLPMRKRRLTKYCRAIPRKRTTATKVTDATPHPWLLW